MLLVVTGIFPCGQQMLKERVCCLLVLNSVTSTPQWIRQPKRPEQNARNTRKIDPRESVPQIVIFPSFESVKSVIRQQSGDSRIFCFIIVRSIRSSENSLMARRRERVLFIGTQFSILYTDLVRNHQDRLGSKPSRLENLLFLNL